MLIIFFTARRLSSNAKLDLFGITKCDAS